MAYGSPDKIFAVAAEDRLFEKPLDKLMTEDNLDGVEAECACALPLVDGRGDGDDERPERGARAGQGGLRVAVTHPGLTAKLFA